MPTLPLFDHPKHPNGWHRVRAPGGYELWHFDVEDLQHDRRVVVDFFAGSPGDESYRRRFFRFDRSPTTVVPPVPSECIGVEVSVYRGTIVERSFAATYPAEQFSASTDALAIQIGPHRVSEADNVIGLWTGGADFSLKLDLRPTLVDTTEREAMTGFAARTVHRRIVAAPLCDVMGELRLGPDAAIAVAGRGFHDFAYGTGAIPADVSRWMRGRVLLDSACAAFEVTNDEARVIEVDRDGSRDTGVKVRRGDARSGSIDLDVIQLREPRVLEASGGRRRIVYRAEWRGRAGEALADVLTFG